MFFNHIRSPLFFLTQNFMKIIRKCMMVGPTLIRTQHHPGGATLKNSTTLIQFLPRREVSDAYLRRRQLPTDEYWIQNFVKILLKFDDILFKK